MRRPRRDGGGLRPLLLLLPFAALLSVATVSLRSADRHFVSGTARRRASSSSRPAIISGLDERSLDATSSPLHAVAARAFRSGGRLLRDVVLSSAPAPPPGATTRCPASVAASGSVSLPLPCGLTLGSHVTVVGVPRRVPGAAALVQFVVELRGEGDGDAAPRILHFNPRLRGDWSGRPVIEQNTRFRGNWGPALRCEGRRSRPDEETGQNGRNEVNEDLKKEADFFGDIVIVPFEDSYDLVVLKTVAICDYVANVVRAKYVMKCDDDTFVRLDSLMAEVKKIPEGKSFYLGNMNYYHRPLREGKWAVSYEEWPFEAYPPYADGAGYIFSSNTANFVVSEMEKGKLNLFKMEDVSMGMWVGKFNSSSRNAMEYVHNDKFCQSGCEDGYLTAHYQSPVQMVCLWEKLGQGSPHCCNAR
ncbi:hypothetical protein PR202_gb11345 [Eleusine coracana subsp. coracana]|uniref:Hexosyltransferase n=1 Tax=Eleusine coracana subsp. coracana TaxID=191504 RepID=A0AAV5EKC8_ELECO|nr:hypothetical protein PR202_gb11345 [Eleusine coracana subsp. coracana]